MFIIVFHYNSNIIHGVITCKKNLSSSNIEILKQFLLSSGVLIELTN